jgi:hypothetical protein
MSDWNDKSITESKLSQPYLVAEDGKERKVEQAVLKVGDASCHKDHSF